MVGFPKSSHIFHAMDNIVAVHKDLSDPRLCLYSYYLRSYIVTGDCNTNDLKHKQKTVLSYYRHTYVCLYTMYGIIICINEIIFKPGAPACDRRAPGFLKLILCGSSVCLFACLCVRP